jgi:hypothetical protein
MPPGYFEMGFPNNPSLLVVLLSVLITQKYKNTFTYYHHSTLEEWVKQLLQVA